MGVRDEVGHIAPVEGMRALACLWVIVFHYTVVRDPLGDPWIALLAAAPWLEALVRNGYLGVDLFFLISGFLLGLPWFLRARQGRPAPSAKAFYLRRIRRIVPAYYVHLAVLFALFVPLLRGWEYWRMDFFVMVWNVVAHAGFVHNTTPLTSGSVGVNGALWTLSVEAQFYLLAPLLALVLLRAPWWGLAFGFAMASWWLWSAAFGLQPLVDLEMRLGRHWQWPEATVRHLLRTQLPAYAGHFTLGMLLGRAWLAWRERPPRYARQLAPLIGAAAFAALLYGLTSPTGLGGHLWVLTTLALGALLFAAAAGSGAIARHALGRGPLAFVGRVSYSAYLYHLPLLLLWNRDVPLPPAATLPLYLATVLLVAWLSWRFVERPDKWGQTGIKLMRD